ncbi:MAG: pyridoxal phosphate-dependent aminotransferase family protein [Petrimonas sp.]|jgi:glycine C-acetyltransferase|uniref:aminotransferase class I/II-fold pyridoxal phosphate-dependent enzyme n=1 Tax=Petrimonas TaxID=307628 RepID=UPI000E86EEF2|nr:pyridoxal phosphate-dependent aminotransferase family protein [Petrimonas sp.]NLU30057.1 pyridoxal phosphate-dependent aminotransferase family protein [Bacteroidales bacterium]BBD44594.1 8-amino-7-oxononanoate synthase [Petrimonas sp. IBARAKI]HAC73388.1 8-amino-7-oxononanoate synthase [Porphyromonadaceae bacterium]MDD2910148.1 pyridoxal phosphate-dependent aminotransferase family protein [Petrimonas sp.]
MLDIFDRLKGMEGPLEQYRQKAEGYFMFPELEGEIGPRMKFHGREVITWSLNNYLGLANHPEVRKADAEAAATWGMAYPMGARMMSGQTKYHKELEERLAKFEKKEAAYLLNYGYQGMVSIIDSLCTRHDVIVYDSESHACIMDGIFLHKAKGGKSFVFPHNDMERAEKMLRFATKQAEENNGGILLITEGVFGMSGDLGNLPGIVALKKQFNFRLMIDDAHGFGTMGKTGAGASEHFGLMNEVDIYFATFAKSMAGIGAFVASDKAVVDSLKYNMRSQIFAKSLPMPMVIGALKRLDILQNRPEIRENLWKIAKALQDGLVAEGFNIGNTQSPVTPVYFSGSVPEGTNIVIDLRENHNVFCSIVVYPVVPKGVLMLRLIPTASHTMKEVNETIDVFKKIKVNLEAGKYISDEMRSMTM